MDVTAVPPGGDYLEQRRMQQRLKDAWRLTPATFAQKITHGEWIPARHLLYISKIIAPAIARGNARIIVTMPARHGKSEFLSVNTHAWHLERWPHKYTMGISYGLDLATDFSLKVRNMFLDEDNHSLLSTRLNKDRLKVDRFLTTKGGGCTAAGVGGIITGRGAHLLTLDDYIKNAEESLSQGQRDKAWEWWKSTAYTRLEPDASIIVLATRWNIDDLIGRMMTDMASENWIIINLPAIAELNDPLGREVGEALWPERYPLERLLQIKRALGSYWWSALYQQNPLPSMAGMNLGDRLKFVDTLPHWNNFKKTFRIWDFAATDQAGDFTAGPLMSIEKGTNNVYIHDMQRFQKSPGGVETMVRATAEHDGYGIPIWMEQEPGSAGKAVVEHFKRTVVPGHVLDADKPTGPIEVRAQPFLAGVECGNVYCLKAGWNKKLVDEINGFPDGDNDDQISALALGYHKLYKAANSGVTWGRDKEIDPTKALKAKATHENKLIGGSGKRMSRLTW